MSYHCIEATIDFVYLDYKVRIWMNLKNLDDDIEAATIVHNAKAFIYEHQNRETILKYLASLPFVNAAQVIRSRGEFAIGKMVYTVPFDEKST